MLVLSGMELTFLIKVLCFGFVANSVDNTPVFGGNTDQCLYSFKVFFLPLCLHSEYRLGAGQEIGKGQPVQLTQTSQRDVPHHTLNSMPSNSCSAVTRAQQWKLG